MEYDEDILVDSMNTELLQAQSHINPITAPFFRLQIGQCRI